MLDDTFVSQATAPLPMACRPAFTTEWKAHIDLPRGPGRRQRDAILKALWRPRAMLASSWRASGGPSWRTAARLMMRRRVPGQACKPHAANRTPNNYSVLMGVAPSARKEASTTAARAATDSSVLCVSSGTPFHVSAFGNPAVSVGADSLPAWLKRWQCISELADIKRKIGRAWLKLPGRIQAESSSSLACGVVAARQAALLGLEWRLPDTAECIDLAAPSGSPAPATPAIRTASPSNGAAATSGLPPASIAARSACSTPASLGDRATPRPAAPWRPARGRPAGLPPAGPRRASGRRDAREAAAASGAMASMPPGSAP